VSAGAGAMILSGTAAERVVRTKRDYGLYREAG
jgi:hypothetical protein